MSGKAVQEWLTSGYDLYKGLIVGVGGACLVFGGLLYYQWNYSENLDVALASAEKDAKQCAHSANEIYELRKQVNDNPFINNTANVNTYFNTCAFNANIGLIDIAPKTDSTKAYEDNKFTITLNPRDRSVMRSDIVAFLFNIENRLSGPKVTGIKMEPPPKEFKSGERRDSDNWLLTTQVTYRRRVEKK